MENQLTSKKSIQKISINFKCLAVTFALFLMLLMEILRPVNYSDEILGIASIIIIVLKLITGKINSYDTKTLILLSIAVLMTLLANLIYNINPSTFSVLVDTLTQVKVFVLFYALRYLLDVNERQRVLEYMTPLAIVFIVSAFLFAVFNQIVDIGMSGGNRYGINIFRFIYSFNHQYAASAIFFFGVIICNNRLSLNTKKLLAVLGIIAILSALKTLSIIFPVVWVALYYYYSRYKRLNLFTIILAIILVVLLSRYQINEYLLDTSSPRRVFFDYAKVDANSHFPLGSGFGTFGSAEAAKNYSQLYIEYGFRGRWGMSPDYKAFLHDNYWQSVIGQFGWIGFSLVVICYIRVFICGVNTESAQHRRAFQIADFLSVLVLAIGSAAITSSTGMICFAIFSLCSENDYKVKERMPLFKFHIKI